jgi:hypothetical protein
MKTGFTMKALSLAVLSLATSSAFAACPANVGALVTAGGGPWTSSLQLPDAASSPINVVAGGLDSSSCKITAALAQDVTANATIRYNHSAPESSYRFQFLVDTSALTGFTDPTTSVVIFNAPSPAANGISRLLRVTLLAGSSNGVRVRFIASTGAGSHTIGQTFATNLTAGVHRIEGKLTVGAGAAGTFSYWIDKPAGTTEPAATGTIPNLDNAAWTGVTAASLGLTAPTQPFVDLHHGEKIGFDTFDSRRTSYIGY